MVSFLKLLCSVRQKNELLHKSVQQNYFFYIVVNFNGPGGYQDGV